MRRRTGSLELDIAAIALLVVAIGVAAAAYRLRRQGDDLGTADRQLRRLTKHNGEQAERISVLESESPAEMLAAMDKQIEGLVKEVRVLNFELDGPGEPSIVNIGGVSQGNPNPSLLFGSATRARESE